MKAILMSIRPEWCDLIIRGQKTIEVRKTRPKLETPFRAYIYCTRTASKEFNSDDRNWDVSAKVHGGWPEKKGRVIGEFTCKKITGLTHIGATGSREPVKLYIETSDLQYENADELLRAACLTKAQAEMYLNGGDGYGWNISDPKIYDRPRLLSNFTRLRATKFGYEPVDIERPPQSWFYVEDGR